MVRGDLKNSVRFILFCSVHTTSMKGRAMLSHVLAIAIAIVALAHVSVAVSSTAFSVSNTFGDHMVLQRDRPAVVFGFAEPATVVSFGALQISVVTGADGIWRIELPAQPASLTPRTLVFSASTGGVVVLRDVLFGDVHFCGGQSNMEFTLLGGVHGGVPNATAEIAAADQYPLIRLFTVGQGTNSTTPLQQLKTIEQPWTVASSASVSVGPWKSFSAVCWFTYRNVFDALGGTVPQGLISNNWGTFSSAFISFLRHALVRVFLPSSFVMRRCCTTTQAAHRLSTGRRPTRWRTAPRPPTRSFGMQ
jgi:hypothetical protein